MCHNVSVCQSGTKLSNALNLQSFSLTGLCQVSKTYGMEPKIVKRLGLGLGTWDLGLGTWDLGPGTWDLGIE